MEDLILIREKINEMAGLALSMLRNTFDGFMKHDLEILSCVLKDEERLNEMERAITLSLIDISKGKVTEKDKKNIVLLTNIVGDLEEVGDYVKDMIERIEIKIQERLLFSEEALVEYRHLYATVETALSNINNSLKLNDNNFSNMVLCGKEDVDKLIEKYRDAHTQRLLSGICDVRSGNMFLNLLDFTGQIFHHARSLAENILGLK
jgi:phosphate:Na+ symporter